MKNRRFSLIAHETRLLFRYGIYYAYAFVVAFYILLLVTVGKYASPLVPVLIIYTDPAVLGFFFLGAIMMLEKSEGTRTALAITPVSALDYLIAKIACLSCFSVVAVTLVASFIGTDINWFILIPSTLLTSVFYICVGVPCALFFKTVTSYLIGAAGVLTPIVVPAFVAFIDPMPAWAIAIPTVAQLRLLMVATNTAVATPLELALMFVVTFGVTAMSVGLSLKWLKKELG